MFLLYIQLLKDFFNFSEPKYAHRFHDVVMQVGYSDTDTWSTCAFQHGILPSGERRQYPCTAGEDSLFIAYNVYGIKGTHVKLSLTKSIDGILDQLVMKEVEVQGFYP